MMSTLAGNVPEVGRRQTRYRIESGLVVYRLHQNNVVHTLLSMRSRGRGGGGGVLFEG